MNDTSVGESQEDITNYIERMSLSDEDKRFWLDRFADTTPEVALGIMEYFETFPDKIKWATDIMKRKQVALDNRDMTAWRQILSEEEQEIQNVINTQQTV